MRESVREERSRIGLGIRSESIRMSIMNIRYQVPPLPVHQTAPAYHGKRQGPAEPLLMHYRGACQACVVLVHGTASTARPLPCLIGALNPISLRRYGESRLSLNMSRSKNIEVISEYTMIHSWYCQYKGKGIICVPNYELITVDSISNNAHEGFR